ncbi:peptide ABC transporter substrate-binding protein [Brachyspira pilosicoli]|uniref:peptide ABC transporter substrate-binding protein n=1 Tax=Brachyspira pilosicoli TaxID=52584 RepID=UPI001C933EF5|nr:peptide ABC transporter substrate-binding protein [Brachyspira pilosicoli]MBW5396155.1 peptide ABC transporter substrate-binding protein [Brachyspira pilosicoli]
MKNIINLFFIFLLSIGLIITSCSSKNENQGEGLFINVGPEPKTIDPTLNIASDASVYIIHAFEGLTTKNKEGVLVGGAAESWDISEDGLTYTFHLRTNGKWSDGTPLTSKDFVYAWKRAVDPKTASEYSYQFEPVKNAMAINSSKMELDTLGIKAIDDYTLEVTLEKPTAYFLELTAFTTFYPIREDIIEKYGNSWTINPESYIGNGSYVMIERNIDNNIVMVKNTNYWDYENLVPEKITFVLMDNPTASVAGIKEGSLHFSDRVPAQDIDTLKEEGLLQMVKRLGTYYYAVNHTNEVLKDGRVRKALSLAIDRNYIVDNIVKAGVPAGAFVPFGAPDVNGDFREVGGDYISVKPEDYQKNIEKAKKLMEEAGYTNGEGFPVLQFIVDSNREIPTFEAVQQMWKEHLGIDTSVSQQEWAVFLQTLYTDKNYVIGRSGWTADYNDPMTFLGMFLSYSPQNHALFTNKEYDNLLQTAMNTIDQNIRMDAMHKAEKIFMDNDVIIPLYYYATPTLVSPKLKGVVYDSLANHKFSYAYIEN